MSKEMAKAVQKAGDQIKGHEAQISDDYSLLIGIRNLYIRYQDTVLVIPGFHHSDD